MSVIKKETNKRKLNCSSLLYPSLKHGGTGCEGFYDSEYLEKLCYCQRKIGDARIIENKREILPSPSRHKKKHLCWKHCSFLDYSIHPAQNTFKLQWIFFVTWILVIGPLLNVIVRAHFPAPLQAPFGGAIVTQACHPGLTNGGSTRPRPNVNLIPFQKNEFRPKVSEQTIGASGPAEGAIYRDSERYRSELSPNFNPDIVFRDEERTNEDRMMSQRCSDRLNVLAIWVINQWPRVKLRVTEGWQDPEQGGRHLKGSLHYEGRAVDLTTSDQDRSKYPLLASLAVEAGFDWVQFETSHVHCSVKSDASPASVNGGCFPGDARIWGPDGSQRRLDELRPGDGVFSLGPDGSIVTDQILGFMDAKRDSRGLVTKERLFVSITVESGTSIRLTPNHLIYKVKEEATSRANSYDACSSCANFSSNFHTRSIALFAGDVKPGDWIFAVDFSNQLGATKRPVRVLNVNLVTSTSGAFAPLTKSGTIVVDNALASCYAVVGDHELAHFAMAPLRHYYLFRFWLASWVRFQPETISNCTDNLHCFQRLDNRRFVDGVSLYTDWLYAIGSKFLSKSLIRET